MECSHGAVVVGDDSLDDRSYLETLLESQGYRVKLAENGEEVLQCLEHEGPVSLVLLDLLVPRGGGLETLREVRKRHNGLPVILMSDVPVPVSVRETIRSQKAGYLEKPILPEHLGGAIQDIFGKQYSAISRIANGTPGVLRPKAAAHGAFMRQIDALISQVGGAGIPVLLQGETGVGKEVLAREIHARSPRAKKPFVKVNCAALPTELVESELFGYERGAFTGAFKDRPGRFEIAREGTILLDEIGDMDVSLQAKLLQVLQDGEFHRLGSRELVKVDVRVMAATHQDLRKAIADGRFREDLYYRLNVINIRIPPVRERRSEILPLAEHFLNKHATPDFPPPPIPSALRESMLACNWPGNIREIENTMRRYLVMRDADLLAEELRGSADSPKRVFAAAEIRASAPEGAPQTDRVEDHSPLQKAERAKQVAEKEAVLGALNATHWNRKKAAALLNIDYKAFLYKMKKLGLAMGNAPAHKPSGSAAEGFRRNGTSG
jgi:two-component system, NtrC family, response regulator AtoC